MRILFVVTDADVGGAERLLATLARSWEKSDVLRLVVVMEPGSLSAELERSFDSVHYLGYSASSRNIVAMVHSLEKEIAAFEPDVISSNLFHADLLTALARTRVPKATTMHTQRLTAEDHPLTRLIARAVGVLSFRFRAVIPVDSSESMRVFLRRLHMRNVVEPIRNSAELAASATFDPHCRVFLSLARNHPVKGHDVLFKAFASVADELPDWSLRAHGPGVQEDDERMTHLIEDAGVSDLVAEGRLSLAGPTSNPAVALEGSAALIISSKYGEAFPVVGAEAAGSGVPVITTDIGSCAGFVDDDRFLVRPDDPSDLARAMREFAHLTDAERGRLSATARSRAEREYDPRVTASRYRDLFVRLIR